MKLLLDTLSLIWFAENDKKLSPNARNTIEDAHNQSFVSMASFWEMAIKHSLGKLHLSHSLLDISKQIQQQSIKILPITFDHVLTLSTLPFYHRDPFDRMLIAQCLCENMTFISADQLLKSYPIPALW